MFGGKQWRLVLVCVIVGFGLSETVVLAKGRGKGKKKGKCKQEQKRKRKGECKGKAYAPKGLNREEKSEWVDGKPPGWSKGRKTGWKGGAVPPGLAKKGKLPPGAAKWSDEQKQEFENKVKGACEKIQGVLKKIKGMTDKDIDSAKLSIENAAEKGVPVEKVYRVVKVIAEKGIKGEGIEKTTRALAYAVGKKIDFNGLGEFINKKVAEKANGDDLAVEIYKEIDKKTGK